jgi:hypothetical protein
MCLIKKSVDDTLAEIAVVIIVHLQDLLKGALIDQLLDIGELGRARLLPCVSDVHLGRPGVLMDARAHLPSWGLLVPSRRVLRRSRWVGGINAPSGCRIGSSKSSKDQAGSI